VPGKHPGENRLSLTEDTNSPRIDQLAWANGQWTTGLSTQLDFGSALIVRIPPVSSPAIPPILDKTRQFQPDHELLKKQNAQCQSEISQIARRWILQSESEKAGRHGQNNTPTPASITTKSTIDQCRIGSMRLAIHALPQTSISRYECKDAFYR
jgi:hypothetical protein